MCELAANEPPLMQWPADPFPSQACRRQFTLRYYMMASPLVAERVCRIATELNMPGLEQLVLAAAQAATA
jgi:hypothetical protein